MTHLPAIVLASIPSSPDNAIGIGPIQLRAYGVAIALGVVAAVRLAGVRWQARGSDRRRLRTL